MLDDILHALLGGSLIGLAASVLLLLNGSISGISGMIRGILEPNQGDKGWKICFLVGLLSAGYLLSGKVPTAFVNYVNAPFFLIGIAGFLVGFGTLLGSGCTSGHGVCGLSRLSFRSLVATLCFMFSGFIMATFIAPIFR